MQHERVERDLAARQPRGACGFAGLRSNAILTLDCQRRQVGEAGHKLDLLDLPTPRCADARARENADNSAVDDDRREDGRPNAERLPDEIQDRVRRLIAKTVIDGVFAGDRNSRCWVATLC